MLRANSRTLPIEDIKIPEAFAQTTPGRGKVEKAKQFYAVTGQFDHTILVDRNGYIFDGYARFVAAKELGLDKVPVVQVVPFERKKKVDKPTEDKPKFKVGDEVKVIGNDHPVHHYVPIGTVTTINVVCKDDVIVEYESQTISLSDVEPYVPSFDWDAFKAGKIAVHCDTEEKAKEFVAECKSRFPHECRRWENGEANWCSYEDETTYSIVHGEFLFADVEYDRDEGFTIIDYPFSEQPTEPTEQKEPIKLYCVKDCICGYQWATEGNTYTIDSDGVFHGDRDLPGGYRSFDDFIEHNSSMKGKLFPLVKRPAKVGEWVLIIYEDSFTRYRKGNLGKTTIADIDNTIRIALENGKESWITNGRYLVLDGYHPEPEAEKEPEYYNGKVVCISNAGFSDTWTVGKVYEFKGGYAITNDGIKTPMDHEPVKEFNELEGMYSPGIKFIEFKGESNDQN